MPIKENITQIDVIMALEPQAITTDTTTTGAIIDTKDYDLGVGFAMLVNGYTDGTYTLKLEDGDDSGLSDAAVVPTASLVYGTLPDLAAALSEGDLMPKEGIHSTKRYVRASIVSTSTSSGATGVAVVAVCKKEICPTDQE